MLGLNELKSCLYLEGLFVHNEQQIIRKLNSQVRNEVEKLAHTFWIVKHHLLHLQMRHKSANESYRELDYNIEHRYCHLLQFIEKLFLLQYACNDQIESKSKISVFAAAFGFFVDFLLDGKLFLTSALHQSLTEIVSDNSVLLQTNREKLITTLTPDEIEKLFGSPDGPEFAENIKNYLKQAEMTLQRYSVTIVKGLLSSFNSFPRSLGWILARFFNLSKGNSSNAKACSVCLDIFFTHFVYDAVLNPVKYGIIKDVVIGETCRFNLTQIVETIQSSVEFENKRRGEIAQSSELTNSLQLLIDKIVSIYDSATVPPVHESLVGWASNAVLIAPYQLTQMIQFLKSLNQLDAPSIDHIALNEILAPLPTTAPACLENPANWSFSSDVDSFKVPSVKEDSAIHTSPYISTPIGTPVSKAASSEYGFSHSRDNIEESHRQTVLVFPLNNGDDPDKRLGMLSEAEILGLNTAPKHKKSRTKTSLQRVPTRYDVSKNFKINVTKSSGINTENKTAKRNNSTKEVKPTSTTKGAGSEDEFVDYKVNPEIRSRYASVIGQEQLPSCNQLSVHMVNNDVIEVACTLTDEEVRNLSKGKSKKIANVSKKIKSTEYLTISNHSKFEPDSSNSNSDARSNISDDSGNSWSQNSSSVLKSSTNSKEIHNGNDRDSLASSCASEASVHSKELEKEHLWGNGVVDLTHPQSRKDDKSDMNENDLRSREKVEKLLGVSVADDDSEWDTTLLAQSKSQNKAERILGVNLLRENRPKAKTKNVPIRRATTKDYIQADGFTPIKRTWKQFKRATSSFVIRRESSPDVQDALELKQGNFLPNQSKSVSRRASSEMYGNFEVMQKYEIIDQQSKKVKNIDYAPVEISSLSSSHGTDSSQEIHGTPFFSNTSANAQYNNHKTDIMHSWLSDVTSSSHSPYKSPCSSADIQGFVKKQLRQVFANYFSPSENFQTDASSWSSTDSKTLGSTYRDQLLSCLQTNLAQTQLMHDASDHVMLSELVRCITMLDEKSCCAVVESLWEDYQRRSQYIAYLVRSKQQLHALLAKIRRAIDNLEREKAHLRHYEIVQGVNSFLKRHETDLVEFGLKFASIAADEKASPMNDFLSSLYGKLVRNSMWIDSSNAELTEAEAEIERQVFARVYDLAMFPNGTVDMERDQVFQSHISEIATVVTPKHQNLQIPDKYLLGYPWLEAQKYARAISTYRSPKDKVEAAIKCCKTVLRMLQLVDHGVPANDDMTPVLLYVIIKTNPPNLLSTVQYVNNFVSSRLSGEDEYYWTVFASALEFMKSSPTS